MSVSKVHGVVGQPIPRLDAISKVTGLSKYLADLRFDRMLNGKVLRSPHPHAKILNIDTSQARKLYGVKAVITAEDTPKIKFSRVPRFADKLPLEAEKVRYVGDEVAAVAASDPYIAEEAVSLIKVEYEPLPAVFDPEEAMLPGSPQIHEGVECNVSSRIIRNFGNAENAFQEADYLFEDTFTTQAQAHCCMETKGSLALYTSGRITLYAPTQTPHPLRQELSRALNIPPSKIRIIKTVVGGGFGSKDEMHNTDVIAALLAMKTGRPVRVLNTRKEEFINARFRHPVKIFLKTAVKKDGTITGRQVRMITDNGAYNSTGFAITANAAGKFCQLYRVPNYQFEGLVVYTNNPYGGAFRGFGSPQAHFAMESQMDMIAEQLDMDPAELRLKNANYPGQVTVSGNQITSCGLKDCINQVVDRSGWVEKRGKFRNRGLGLAALIHSAGGFRGVYGNCDFSDAIVKVNDDGSVDLLTGASDIGQGSDTILAQIAAEEIGMGLSEVNVISGDTDVIPMDLGTYGSRVTFVAGNAVKRAAAEAKDQILKAASILLEARLEDLEISMGFIYVKGSSHKAVTLKEVAAHSYYGLGRPIIGRGFYDTQGTCAPDAKGFGNTSETYHFAAQVVEVEVDPGTGLMKILDCFSAHDIGKVINPLLAEGQVEGAFAQGIGFALFEDLKMDQGRVRNPSFRDYKVPTPVNLPLVRSIFVETKDPTGPFGAKGGIGEAGMVATAAAVANAIYDAIGVRFKELPITPEKILTALKQKGETFKANL